MAATATTENTTVLPGNMKAGMLLAYRQESCRRAGSPQFLSYSVSHNVSTSKLPSSCPRRERRGTTLFTNNNEQNDFHQQNASKRRHIHNRELTPLSDTTKTLNPQFEPMVA